LFPFLDLQAQFAAIRSEVTLAVERVLETQRSSRPDVQKLERDVANGSVADTPSDVPPALMLWFLHSWRWGSVQAMR